MATKNGCHFAPAQTQAHANQPHRLQLQKKNLAAKAWRQLGRVSQATRAQTRTGGDGAKSSASSGNTGIVLESL